MRAIRMESQGGWLMERVRGWGCAASVAGSNFEAYLRLLHPVPDDQHPWSAVGVRSDSWQTRRWADIALDTGKVIHPLVQWGRLSQPPTPYAPGSSVGWLDPEVLAALVTLLKSATSTPDELVAGFWDGWGGAPMTSPTSFSLPGRDYSLVRATLDELADPDWGLQRNIGWNSTSRFPSTQLLWPGDRMWVVATEIDWDSTIVAGTRALIDAVTADPRFETYEVNGDDDLSWEGDTIN